MFGKEPHLSNIAQSPHTEIGNNINMVTAQTPYSMEEGRQQHRNTIEDYGNNPDLDGYSMDSQLAAGADEISRLTHQLGGVQLDRFQLLTNQLEESHQNQAYLLQQNLQYQQQLFHQQLVNHLHANSFSTHVQGPLPTHNFLGHDLTQSRTSNMVVAGTSAEIDFPDIKPHFLQQYTPHELYIIMDSKQEVEMKDIRDVNPQNLRTHNRLFKIYSRTTLTPICRVCCLLGNHYVLSIRPSVGENRFHILKGPGN
jgi:hypothetical protein